MPIVITNPEPSQPPGTNTNRIFEVGQYLRAVSDHIGPLSDQAFWTTQVWLSSNSEQFVMNRRYPWTKNEFKTFMWQAGINNAAESDEGRGVRPITPGAAATLRVMLDDPTSAFHEEATVTGVMAQFDQALRVSGQATAQAGFTASDRENLAVVQASVQVPLPISTAAGAVAQTALGQFVSSAPIQLLSRQECRSISGTGSLTRPSPLYNVNAIGFSWAFLAVPTYFGRAPGAVLEFQQRIVQFSIVQRDFTGVEHVAQVIDAHSDQQFATWGLNAPFRIDYSVTAGCAVQFCWLLLLGS